MRTLPLDEGTLKMLNDYIKRGGPVTLNGKELLFGINRHRGWQIIKECAEKAGLPKLIDSETGRIHNVSPHKLRDCFAILAMKTDDSGDGLRLDIADGDRAFPEDKVGSAALDMFRLVSGGDAIGQTFHKRFHR